MYLLSRSVQCQWLLLLLLPAAVNDGQHFILAHDEVLLAIELDLLARVLAEEDQIARLDIEGDTLAVVVHLAIARRDDLALLRLLFGRVRDDDPADFLQVAWTDYARLAFHLLVSGGWEYKLRLLPAGALART